MTTAADKPARTSRKKPGKLVLSEVPVPVEAPPTPDLGPYQPGDYVVCLIGGQSVSSGIVALHVTAPARFDVVNRNGRSTVGLSDIVCRDDWSPARALRVGDRVRIPVVPHRQGQVLRVTADAVLNDIVPLENLADPTDTASVLASGVRVLSRANIADLYADLSLRVPEELQAAPAEGWMFPNSSHLAHWGDGTKVLCGRYIPSGTQITGGDDQDAYRDRTCSKCRKALNKREAETPGPALPEASPELTPALVVPVPVQALPAEPPAFPIPEIEPLRTGLQDVPWNRILNSDLNPRKHFELEALKSLAISIARKGLRQNLQLRPHPTRPGFYEIAAGERRWRAIGLLVKGLEVGEGEARETLTVPADYPVAARVDELTDRELLEQAMSENVQRNDMTPLEVADGYAAMVSQGATVDELARQFGVSRRLVQRRVDISRHLTGKARELYDEGKLPVATAEVLALASPAVQESVFKSHLKHGQVAASEVKKAVLGHLFLARNARFPLDWYAGKVQEADLFDDLPAYFTDFDEALRLQVKHAQALAEQDVREGAAFADVDARAEQQAWKYRPSSAGATGVFYWIDNRTGELTRLAGLVRNDYYSKDEIAFRLDAPQPVPTHETPGGPASAAPAGSAERFASVPAPAPARPTYPATHEVGQTLLTEVLTDAVVTDEHLTNALYVTTCLTSGYMCADLPGVAQATQLVHELEGDFDEVPLSALLGHLLGLPADAVKTLAQGYMADQIQEHLGNGDAVGMLAGVRPFRLTEAYLKACNEQAVTELWDDAELGSRENTSPSYLRSILLEEAPALAARGFLPRPLREEA